MNPWLDLELQQSKPRLIFESFAKRRSCKLLKASPTYDVNRDRTTLLEGQRAGVSDILNLRSLMICCKYSLSACLNEMFPEIRNLRTNSMIYSFEISEGTSTDILFAMNESIGPRLLRRALQNSFKWHDNEVVGPPTVLWGCCISLLQCLQTTTGLPSVFLTPSWNSFHHFEQGFSND